MAAVILQPEQAYPQPAPGQDERLSRRRNWTMTGGDQHGHDADNPQGPERFTNKKLPLKGWQTPAPGSW